MCIELDEKHVYLSTIHMWLCHSYSYSQMLLS
jgi:hypothetical protein